MGTAGLLDARAPEAWLRRFARTTPGVVGVIAVVVAASCVIAGLVCGAQLDGRIAKSQSVLDRAEPLAYSAQKLYAALSAADAAAATAFLMAGIETAQIRARYEQALADAASALVDTTAGAADAGTRTALAEIAAQLTAYTGLVESAQANNRQDLVVGSSYFREASALMQTSILPGAKKIYTGDIARLDDDQRAVGSAPVAGYVALALVLVAIGVSSVILVHRTNRQFNMGLVVAAMVALVVIGWIAVATGLAAGSIERSRTEGTAKFGRLGNARIVAEQARTDETLELITRGDITAAEDAFNGHINDLVALLGSGPSAAADALQRWTASHRKQVDDYRNSDYNAAVSQAIGAGPDGSAAQFALVESSLRDDIEHTRATLRDEVSRAGSLLAWSPTGSLALMVVAAAAAVAGLWPRLKEFL